jgi:hypothetical protein
VFLRFLNPGLMGLGEDLYSESQVPANNADIRVIELTPQKKKGKRSGSNQKAEF